MASRKAIATISKLLEQTTTKAVPVENLDTWLRVLAPLDDELAIAAALRVVRHTTKPFAVPPGAIFVAAEEILNEQLPSDGEAWALVLSVTNGERRKDEIPEPVRMAAEQIGWLTIRFLDVGDATTRAHFLRFYREAQRKATCNLLELGQPEPPAISTGA